MVARGKLRDFGGTHRRFVAPTVEPDAAFGLGEDHPAVVEGRTLFRTRVTDPREVPRLLIGGENNSKIGGKVFKGAWKGLPVYTLTLEERATCPRSCLQWDTCYGNAMQWPRRLDVRKPGFLKELAAELAMKAAKHRGGYVVRLHVLGDFYSVAYVDFWADMLARLPQLHVYGYTARRQDRDDRESRAIAAALEALRDGMYERFAIRTSHGQAGRDRTIVVRQPVDQPDVIMCPAQSRKEMSCGDCGLCWSPAARDKTIAFLVHGMKRTRSRPFTAVHPADRTYRPAKPRVVDQAAERLATISDEEKARISAAYGVKFR